MARIQWDKTGERYYNSGVDRGVAYVGGAVAAWNGITSVSIRTGAAAVTPRYNDGVVRGYSVVDTPYSATLNAFTYPEILDACLGVDAYYDGLYLDEQPRNTFNLTYREHIGNDVEGASAHYKIHLLYRVVAIPREYSQSSITPAYSPSSMSWDLNTIPSQFADARHVGHIIIDSETTPDKVLHELESYLYGDTGRTPAFPTFDKLFEIWGNYSDLIVEDLGGGKFTLEGPTVKRNGDRYSVNHSRVILNGSRFEIYY